MCTSSFLKLYYGSQILLMGTLTSKYNAYIQYFIPYYTTCIVVAVICDLGEFNFIVYALNVHFYSVTI